MFPKYPSMLDCRKQSVCGNKFFIMIYFLIPAYDEEKNIAKLLHRTIEEMSKRDKGYHVVLVSDGGQDKTIDIAKTFIPKMPLEILSYSKNQGPGYAFNFGLKQVFERSKNKDDIIITKEADNTSSWDIFDLLIQKIDMGFDMALASCYMPGGRLIHTTLDRKVLSMCANFLIRYCLSLHGIYTFSSFYRAYSVKALKKAYTHYGGNLITENGFTSVIEILVKLHRLGMKIVEVPNTLDCSMRMGKSNMKKLTTSLNYFKLMWNLRR